MEYKIYKKEDFRVSNWTGGKTTQLAIFPDDASYLERNFVWRLSSATCENEESDFSKLPDFDRVLLVLEGSVVLAHKDQRVARLSELEQDSFDGGYDTKSFGKITDYNLMVAKGNKGYLDVLTLEEKASKVQITRDSQYSCMTQSFYCRNGYGTITINGETLMLLEGQQLVINGAADEELEISLMGEGILIRGQIFYDYKPEEMGPTVIPSQKATFDDFKACVFLANSQFHGARFLFKKMKTTWYDEALSKAIKKLEQVYATFIVCVIGIIAITAYGLAYLQDSQWILVMALWILLDIFLVSPLIYLIFLPKPVRAHMKDINHLTPYEQKVYQKELETNERLDKILKKYRNSGNYQYDEKGNRIEPPNARK